MALRFSYSVIIFFPPSISQNSNLANTNDAVDQLNTDIGYIQRTHPYNYANKTDYYTLNETRKGNNIYRTQLDQDGEYRKYTSTDGGKSWTPTKIVTDNGMTLIGSANVGSRIEHNMTQYKLVRIFVKLSTGFVLPPVNVRIPISTNYEILHSMFVAENNYVSVSIKINENFIEVKEISSMGTSATTFDVWYE